MPKRDVAEKNAELIATLEFWYEPNPNPDKSSAERQIGPKEYQIFLRPKSDSGFLKQLKVPETQKAVESIMAHELGHFLAQVMRDPTHNPMLRQLLGPLAGEEKAWKLAEKITDIDSTVEKKALDTYRKLYE